MPPLAMAALQQLSFWFCKPTIGSAELRSKCCIHSQRTEGVTMHDTPQGVHKRLHLVALWVTQML